MEVTHNINYDGVEYEIYGEYETPEEETGFKGGFSYWTISVNGQEISQHLRDQVIDKLVELVIEENY